MALHRRHSSLPLQGSIAATNLPEGAQPKFWQKARLGWTMVSCYALLDGWLGALLSRLPKSRHAPCLPLVALSNAMHCSCKGSSINPLHVTVFERATIMLACCSKSAELVTSKCILFDAQ